VEAFLKYIKEHRQGSARLFQTFAMQPISVKAEESKPVFSAKPAASEASISMTDVGKKRSYPESQTKGLTRQF